MLGPSLHAIQKTAHLKKFDASYTSVLVERAKILHKNRVPLIFSLGHLSRLTGVSYSYLNDIVSHREVSQYKVFNIRKKSGGFRRICVPVPELEVVQRWIHKNILKSPGALKTIHDAARAYLPGSSIFKNAIDHAGCQWLIKIDLKDFFESTSERQVYHVFRNLGYNQLLSFQIARICTRVAPSAGGQKKRKREMQWRWTAANRVLTRTAGLPYTYGDNVGHLPQGAPTSPLLSNLVFSKLDDGIERMAAAANGTYTRYADDIVISFSESTRAACEDVIKQVRTLITKSGYRINDKKSGIRSSGGRLVITGLTVNDVTPKLKKEERLRIQAALYHINNRGLLAHAERIGAKNPLNYINHLHGKIVFAKSIEPEFGQQCLDELNEALAKNNDVISLLRSLDSTSNTENSSFKKRV